MESDNLVSVSDTILMELVVLSNVVYGYLTMRTSSTKKISLSLFVKAPGFKWVGEMARRDPTKVVKTARKRNMLTYKNMNALFSWS